MKNTLLSIIFFIVLRDALYIECDYLYISLSLLWLCKLPFQWMTVIQLGTDIAIKIIK